ncbi:MAG: dihydropteroate synthase [Bacteroidales bacterium]|nr:dihydropteroate synthase [Bacteroidales bacterium]
MNCRGKLLDLSTPVVMGILNVTPDSFYDGGKYNSEKDVLIQAEKMISEGAAIIDVGAVSTKPGAKDVTEEEEKKRLFPLLEKLIKEFPETNFSVDTYRSGVAEMAIDKGAAMINDISAGGFDERMFEVIAKYNVPYIIMHIKGTPQNMQKNPTYENVVKEIMFYFSEKISILKSMGINDIIIDPGFGFGKTVENNYEILKNLRGFETFGLPILVGVSRKSMINKVLSINPEDALNATTSLNTFALMNGANILRVHDVKEAVEAIKIIKMFS